MNVYQNNLEKKHQYSCDLGFMAQVHPLYEMPSTKKILKFGLSRFWNICTYMVSCLWDILI